MEHHPSLRSSFARNHLLMSVTLSGDFERTDVDRFQAEVVAACRGRRREWTLDVRDLEFADSAFVGALQWLRTTWGPVCVLNPTPAVRRLLEVTGVDTTIVVRSDARARV